MEEGWRRREREEGTQEEREGGRAAAATIDGGSGGDRWRRWEEAIDGGGERGRKEGWRTKGREEGMEEKRKRRREVTKEKVGEGVECVVWTVEKRVCVSEYVVWRREGTEENVGEGVENHRRPNIIGGRLLVLLVLYSIRRYDNVIITFNNIPRGVGKTRTC
ncbi:hypothetical protein RIF29_35502 [Crotalaria pallida]|uniref:Uncharacterized protein n=1 Tax=Crotalaria pallida TaxID=3830 RepID=A0AAN9EA01_CROPI